jgi:LmbE family N-acetylglucosaminyl deacetylase
VNTRASATLQGHVAVLSPHLDDAVYSLGGVIHKSARAGAHIKVITVFAGDPASTRPASAWDRRFGFRLAGEAARVRREEDGRACGLLGASPVWLPFDDELGESVADDAVWQAVLDAVGQADTVLLPGFPLSHPDHERLSRLVLGRRPETWRMGLYVEQPYAAVLRVAPTTPPTLADVLPSELDWRPLQVNARAHWQRFRAWRAYRSQFRHFGYRSLMNVVRYERRHGGELAALL